MTHLTIIHDTIFFTLMCLNSLWLGSSFFYSYGVQNSLSLLTPVQQTSIKLQCLKKIFWINWGCLLLLFILEGLFFFSGIFIPRVQYISIGAVVTLVLAFFIVFRAYFKLYTKAKRSIRPKPDLFIKINTLLKFIVFLSIINCALLNFVC